MTTRAPAVLKRIFEGKISNSQEYQERIIFKQITSDCHEYQDKKNIWTEYIRARARNIWPAAVVGGAHTLGQALSIFQNFWEKKYSTFFLIISSKALYSIIFPNHTQHTAQQTGNVILLFDRMKDFYHGSQFYLQTNEEQSNLGKPKVVVLMIACGFWVLLWSSLTYNNDTIIFF